MWKILVYLASVVNASSFTYVSFCAIISLNTASRSWYKQFFSNNRSQRRPQWPVTTTLEQSPRPVKSPLELCQSTAPMVTMQSPGGTGVAPGLTHPGPIPIPAAAPSQACGGWPQLPGGQKWSQGSYKPSKCCAGIQTGGFHLPLWSGQGKIKNINDTFTLV